MERPRSIDLVSISTLPPSGQRLFEQYGMGKHVPVPFQTIHEAFRHQARTQPHAIAVEHLGGSISFGDLDQQSGDLAWRLRDKDVGPGARVMLLARRSIPYSIAIFATLQAGGQYVPVDGTIATDTIIHHILVDVAVNVVVSMEAFVHRVAYAGLDVVLLESAIRRNLDERSSGTLNVGKVENLNNGEVVYIVYTSGTTGKPKGVDIRHSSVCNLVCLKPGNLGMKPGLRVSQLLDIQFDMAQWECLGSWANGCTPAIRGRDWKAILKT